MRKELYKMLCDRLREVGDGAVKHIDLWNHNVEFIEQEDNWPRPAVFIEFQPIKWNAIVNGVEYRAEPFVKLHIITDWTGQTTPDSPHYEEGVAVFDLIDDIHRTLACLEGETFKEFDLVESHTNHNHEDIIENASGTSA